MDKNTLYGLVCMAAIFFGFMYCNRPAQQPAGAETAQTATAAEENVATADSLSQQHAVALAEAVARLGEADNTGASFKTETFDLRSDSTHVSGSVTIDGSHVDIARLYTTGDSTLSQEVRSQAIAEVTALIARSQKYKGLARHLSGVNTATVLEDSVLRVTIDSRGAMISSVVLKKYDTEVDGDAHPIELFQGDNDGYGFTFTTADQRFNTREFNFTPVVESDTTVLMNLDLGEGASWGIRYTLHPDNYIVSMEVVQKDASALLPQSTSSIDFDWHQTMARNEKGRSFEERNSGIMYKYVGEGPDELSAHKDDDKTLSGRVKWIAFKNQFFSSAIIARDSFTSASLESRLNKTDRYLKDLDAKASLPFTTADGVAASFDFYFGPNDYPLLSDIEDKIASADGENLDLIRLVPMGWGLFRWINKWITIPVFELLNSFVSNYGIIILIMTILIKLVLFPLTYKSLKSQARMRLLQPEIKAINDKYPGQENAMKRQQETMSLYSRTGSSPFSGCLPMLLSMPFLIAMFSFFPSAIELRGQSFLWAHDLSAPDFIITLPFSIPFYGNGVSLFCLLMTIVNIVYMHINMQNQPGGSSMPGMKLMSYFMPVMFLFIFNDYASGLTYYYLLSLFITIAQTWAVRHFMDEDKVRAEMLANAKKPRKKSGFMARLEEAQRQQQAMMRQQQAGRGKRR